MFVLFRSLFLLIVCWLLSLLLLVVVWCSLLDGRCVLFDVCLSVAVR